MIQCFAATVTTTAVAAATVTVAAATVAVVAAAGLHTVDTDLPAAAFSSSCIAFTRGTLSYLCISIRNLNDFMKEIR